MGAECRGHVPGISGSVRVAAKQAPSDLSPTVPDDLKPTAISLDFEIAAFQEVQAAFPNAQSCLAVCFT